MPLRNTGSWAAEGLPRGASPGLRWVRILPTPLTLHGTLGKSASARPSPHLLKTQAVICEVQTSTGGLSLQRTCCDRRWAPGKIQRNGR